MKKIVFSLILLGSQTNTFGGGFKIGLQGQKQIGMAHIGTALALDASSIYFNPGALAFTPNNLTVGVTMLSPRGQFLDSATQVVTNANSQTFTPFELYASYGISKKLVAGLGIYTPFGSGVAYPTAWTGRAILNKISLQAIYIQPTISYKITDNLSAGFGFVYSTGNVVLEKDIPLQSQTDSVWGNAALKGAASGMGFNLGVYYTKNKLSLGATYHSRVNMKVSNGDAVFTHIPAAAAALFPSTTFTSALPLPSELSLGGAYKVTSKLLLAADLNYTFWNAFDSLGFDYAANTSKLTDAKSARLYKDAAAIRLGAQYAVNNKLNARAGIFYDATPTKAEYVSPELPDNNKTGLTLGASYMATSKLSIDVSYMYENLPKRNVSNAESKLAGTYASKVNAFGIGVSYNFSKSKK
jgi:long-chain fatty acid transport protein